MGHLEFIFEVNVTPIWLLKKQFLGVRHRKELRTHRMDKASGRFIQDIAHFQEGKSGRARRRTAAPKRSGVREFITLKMKVRNIGIPKWVLADHSFPLEGGISVFIWLLLELSW